MRLELSIKGPMGPIGVVIYRQKLDILSKVLSLIESYRFIKNMSFSWVIFRGPTRSIFSPKIEYTMLLHEDLIDRKKIRELSIKEVIENTKLSLEKLWSKGERGKVPILRDSEIVFGFTASFFGYNITGTIHVRGSGWMRREYGDIEIIPYYVLKTNHKIEDMAELYKKAINDFGDEVPRIFIKLSEALVHGEFIKNVLIQPIDLSIKIDYDQIYAVAHRDIASHLALIVRFMKKKRERYVKQKLRQGMHDTETRVFKKLSTYIQISTLYGKVSRREEFRKATIETYREANTMVSGGSLIISTITGKPFGEKLYLTYLREVLEPLIEKFPEDTYFNKWIEEGLMNLRRKRHIL